MTIQYHSGVALAKKKGKDIHVVETPTGIGDLLPVATAGTAYPRQLRYRFADVVNVKDYGAVGDGVHDDTAAIQKALSVGARTVFFPHGEYLVSSAVAIYENTDMLGHGATILCNVDTDVFTVDGRGLSGGVGLAANVTSGATLFSTKEAHGLSAGDIALIWGQRNCLSPVDAGAWCLGPHEGLKSYFAEPLIVKSAEETSFTSTRGIIFPDYLVDNSAETTSARASTTIHKISFCEGVSVRGITFKHYGSGSCVRARWAKDLRIDGVSVYRGIKQGLSIKIEFCYGTRLADITMFGDPTLSINADTPDFYKWGPIDVTSSWNTTAVGWHLYNTVTGMDMTFADGRWPSMFLTFSDSYVEGALAVPSTTHPGSYGYTFRGNTFVGCAGGLVLRSRAGVISGNHVAGPGADVDGSYGIYMFGAAVNSLVIGNIVTGCCYGVIDHPYSSAEYVLPERNVRYIGNDIDAKTAFYAPSAPDGSIRTSNVEVSGNRLKYTYVGVNLGRWRHGFYVHDNDVIGPGSDAEAGQCFYCGKDSTRHVFLNNRVSSLGKRSDGNPQSIYGIQGVTDASQYPTQVGANAGVVFGYDWLMDGVGRYLNNGSYHKASELYGAVRVGNRSLISTEMKWPANALLSVSDASALIGLQCLSDSGSAGIIGYNPAGEVFGRMLLYVSDSSLRLEVGSQSYRAIESSFYPYQSGSSSLGRSASLWSEIFSATGTINTSDARCKENVAAPDDALMRAWGKVGFKVFQFKDAVEKKGGDARIHVGVIAQEVKAAFESEGLDASRYGLFCHDAWEDEYEDVTVVDQPEVTDEDGNITTPEVSHVEKLLVTAAGDRYGIRYEEALALECAYQRWRLAQIEARL